MNNQSRSTPKVNSLFLPRRGFLLLLLTVCVMLYILSWMNNLQFQKTANPAFIPQEHQSFCAFRPISSKESLEEEKILKSITWPKTPSITSNYTFENSSNPLCSNFTILPKVGEGGQWYIGDQLEVSIIIKDYYCYPKTSGGDVLLASLKNRDLQAGVSGQVVDHLNGSYTAVFPLVWEGQAEVEVTLVHPSEAVTVLQRLNSEEPDRINYRSIFRSGSVSETTECNICLRPSKRPVCDFTDVRTGEPWFCLKPKKTKLNCTNRISHKYGVFVLNLQKEEKRLFQDKINMKTPILAVGSSSITVYQRKTGPVMLRSNNVKTAASGFYYKGVWKSLGITEVQQFDTAAIIQCLKGKVVHMYGDSTIRQFFDYLNKALPNTKIINRQNLARCGPFKAEDRKNNILVTYRCHGPPIRFLNVPIQDLCYIANELDSVSGGASTVVLIGVWIHFTSFPLKIYIRRLMSIRSAVRRLLARAPDTIVVIKTGTPQELRTLFDALTMSEWFSLKHDKVLRALFKGMNVHLVDAWEMVLAHQLPHKIHPEPPIIKNMINVLLSYTCPKMHSENNL
uniref:NXPE family member 3-like n=1 Tax=Gouania willdenowi TaxID=441366 RepID=A0A8C5G1N0_GOUWI